MPFAPSRKKRIRHGRRVQDAPAFAALADPVRRSLLLNLAANSPKTATQLAREYPMTRQGILKHLHVLEAARLVAVQRQGREARYALTPEPLEELEQFVKQVGDTLDARLLRLKAFVESDAGDK
jgi:DNA-binding transcriptional ArsR family regulator